MGLSTFQRILSGKASCVFCGTLIDYPNEICPICLSRIKSASVKELRKMKQEAFDAGYRRLGKVLNRMFKRKREEERQRKK